MSSQPLPDLALQLMPVPSSGSGGRAAAAGGNRFEVVFASFFRQGHALTFPCSQSGEVDIDSLPPAARRNYADVCARVGRDYALPLVRPISRFTH